MVIKTEDVFAKAKIWAEERGYSICRNNYYAKITHTLGRVPEYKRVYAHIGCGKSILFVIGVDNTINIWDYYSSSMYRVERITKMFCINNYV